MTTGTEQTELHHLYECDPKDIERAGIDCWKPGWTLREVEALVEAAEDAKRRFIALGETLGIDFGERGILPALESALTPFKGDGDG